MTVTDIADLRARIAATDSPVGLAAREEPDLLGDEVRSLRT